jgi:glycine hydroxymethyltransferase
MAVAQETFQHLTSAGLAEIDPEIAQLLVRELERQRGQIELIASENFTWPSILEAIGSTPTNKYAEGYPGRR